MILRFILLKIRAHKIRSSIVILSTLLMSIFLSALLFLYSNIVAFNSYYQLDGVDPRRISITSDTSFFELFGKEKSGLSEEIEMKIKNDPLVDHSYFLTFVEIPVLAQMDIFSFHLATDIPVFGISDEFFSGISTKKNSRENIPIGISKSMLEFYNLQVAGSASFFPRMNEYFLKGQIMTLEFGKSKLFDYAEKSPILRSGSVVTINQDLPGFGLSIPLSVVQGSLQKLGYKTPRPYRAIIYLKNIEDIEKIKSSYQGYTFVSDRDKIAQAEKNIQFLRSIFLTIAAVSSSLLILFLGFIFAGILRENSRMFTLFHMIGVHRSYIWSTIYLELGSLAIVGSILGSIVSIIGSISFTTFITQYIASIGLGFSPISLTGLQIGGLFFIQSTILFLLITLLGYQKVIYEKN
ncbi:MAG: hypothetical protein U0518_04850 [Candidatus Gracilibacteria bacterium]